jgi:dTDP-glucose pyrophosphorylase
MEQNELRIVLVTDEKRVLRGIVTDGDIRRAILSGVSLEDPVTAVMTNEPTVVQPHKDRKAVLALMREKNLLHVPVVDEAGRVVGLEVIDHIVGPESRPNPVVLMAGGLGTRLRPLTSDCPKPLLKVGGKPILETILDNLVSVGFDRFFISVNYKSEMIEEYFGDGTRWGIDIQYLYEEKRLGTAGPLSLLPDVPDCPLLVMNGDLLTNLPFGRVLDYHQDRNVLGTMCVRDHDMQVPFGVVQMEDERITDIEEKPVYSYFVNAGVYVLDPQALSYVPHDTFFDMPDLFKRLIGEQRGAATFPIQEYWMDIGHREDFQQAQNEFDNVFA